MNTNEQILALVDDLNDYEQVLKQAEIEKEQQEVWIEKVKGWIHRDEQKILELRESMKPKDWQRDEYDEQTKFN